VNAAARPRSSGADGEWHRLHPATPLLRGGIIGLAILGWAAVQLRDVWINAIVGDVVGRELPDDPASRFIASHLLWAIVAAIAIVAVFVGAGWLAWRMHEYRVTDELVEEREGILWRRHRRGRLDRVQGVNIERPLIARLVGAARLEVAMAGNDGNIRLSYLSSRTADELRRGILAAAAEVRRVPVAERPSTRFARSGTAERDEATRRPTLASRISTIAADLSAPELDVELATPTSLVEMHPGRLVAATALSLVRPLLLLVVIVVVIAALSRAWFAALIVIPAVIAVFGIGSRRILRSLRYSISETPDGIRVGYGLLSTANETLPASRIHAIQLDQPLLWRPFGWWSIRINRASRGGRDGAPGRPDTRILPVGTIEEARRVVALILPGWEEPAAFTISPPRARWLRWFSRRRNGFAIDGRVVALRRGALWRTLTLVPLARVQSVAIEDGPLTRALRLARVEVHTVEGVIRGHIGALDAADAVGLWRETEARALGAMS